MAEVIIAKHRNGPVDTIKLAFVKKYAAFKDLEQGLRPPDPGGGDDYDQFNGRSRPDYGDARPDLKSFRSAEKIL